MPIYEYKCRKCGKEFELLVMGDGTKPACEHCGSSSVDKQFSAFAVGSSAGSAPPDCAQGCGGGFTGGTCGSGMCGGAR